MTRNHTIAAVLQLIAACSYLALGVISSQNLRVVEFTLFTSMVGWYGGAYGFPNPDSAAFFSATIMPLVVGAIGLILVYGLWKGIKHTWKVSVPLNFLGIFVIALIFIPILLGVQLIYSAPSPPETFVALLHSYDPYFSVLFLLVPVAVILSMATAIFALAVGLSEF